MTDTASTTVELDELDDHQADEKGNPGRDEETSAATVRRLAGWLILGGCVIAAGCIAFIVWEQWQANKAALESHLDPSGADLSGFPYATGPRSATPPGPSAPDQPGANPGSAGSESGPASE